MRTSFVDKLEARWKAGRHLCVGLDLDPKKFPDTRAGWGSPFTMREFGKAIVRATAPFAAAFKPNLAFYLAESGRGVLDLVELLEFIRAAAPEAVTILDGKFGDIGNTNEAYARFAFDVCGADAITVNPYVGQKGLAPFLDRADRGAFVLCRTSNPGADEFQDLRVDEGKADVEGDLCDIVAEAVSKRWNTNGNCGLVVGATAPEELAAVREIAPYLPILIPGVGAQGGDLAAAVKAAKHRFLVNVSRGIAGASQGADFAEAATREAKKLHHSIRAALEV